MSVRSVDDLVAALGIDSGISKSEVSRICAGLDEVVAAFRTRWLDHTTFPYVYLDTTYLHVRNTASQVVSMAVVVATGITADGGREVLGLDVGTARARCSGTASSPPSSAAPDRSTAGHLRPAQRPRSGPQARIPGHAHQRCRVDSPATWSPWYPRHPHHLRPTRAESRRRDLGPGPRPARRPVPED